MDYGFNGFDTIFLQNLINFCASCLNLLFVFVDVQHNPDNDRSECLQIEVLKIVTMF